MFEYMQGGWGDISVSWNMVQKCEIKKKKTSSHRGVFPYVHARVETLFRMRP